MPGRSVSPFRIAHIFVLTLALFVLGGPEALGQTQGSMFYSGDFNGFNGDEMTYNSTTGNWVVTVQAPGDNTDSGFLFRDDTNDFSPKWAAGGDVSFDAKRTWFEGGADGVISVESGKYYTFVFKDVGDEADSEGFVTETNSDVVTISSVTQNPSPVYPRQFVTITADLSAGLPTGQGIYLRYSTDGFGSSTITQMECSNGSCTADIPSSANAGGTSVSYYVLSSGDGASISHSNADLFTINLNNGGGSNYNYTVASTWATSGSGDGSWDDPGAWAAGTVPVDGAPVTIQDDLTLDTDASVRSLTINNGVTFAASDGSGRLLTVANGGTLTNSGTFDANGGTLKLVDGGTLTNNGTFNANTGTVAAIGDNVASVPGSLTLNDVTVSTSDSQNTGIDFGSGNATVEGTLRIEEGGFVDANPPEYGGASTLVYDATGTTYGRSIEWSASSGAGYPENVTIQNNTTVDLSANGGGAREVNGNLTIKGDSQLDMAGMVNPLTVNGNITVNSPGTLTLGSNIGGDLFVRGNFTLDGTVNGNSRLVEFDGSSNQTISGSTDPSIDFFEINNGSGVTLDGSTLTVSNTLTLTQGTISRTNSGALTLGVGSSVERSNGELGFAPTFDGTVNVTYTAGLDTGPELPSDASTLQTLTVDASDGNTVTLTGDVTVNTDLALTSGTLSRSGSQSLTLSGSQLSRSGGEMDFAPAVSGSASVVYESGGMTTGPELPATASGDITLEVDAGGTVTLQGGLNPTLGGDLNVLSGTLDDNGNAIAVNGGANVAAGQQIGGSGTVTFTGGSGTAPHTLAGSGNYGEVEIDETNDLGSVEATILDGATFTTLTAAKGVLDVQSSGAVAETVTVNSEVRIGGPLDVQSSATVEGTLAITDASNGNIGTTAPEYGDSATLVYASGGTYGRFLEWSSTSGAGYPTNVTIRNGTTLDLSNDGLENDGSVVARALKGDVMIEGSSTLDMNDMSASLTVGGSVTVNGTFTLGSNPGGDLDVEGSSVTVQGGDVQLQGSILNLDAGANTSLDEQSGGLVTGGGPDVGEEIGGTIVATRTVDSPSSGVNVAGLGAVINTSANLGAVTVTRGHAAQENGGGNQSIERYYDISPSQNNSGLDADLTFNYAEEELSGLLEGKLTFFKSEDGGSTWSGVGVNSRDTDANTAALSGVQSFSRWTLGSEDQPLPVELTSFDAHQTDPGAVLSWTTASETNNSGFAVQHAVGEQSFENVGWVDGAGTTTEAQDYSFSLEALAAGTHRFRLKQEDLDGTTSVSEATTLTVAPDGAVAVQAAPHPVRHTSQVRVTAAESGPMTVALYDVLGRRVETLHEGRVTANQAETFTLDGSSLAAGTYFLHVQGDAFTRTERVTVAR